MIWKQLSVSSSKHKEIIETDAENAADLMDTFFTPSRGHGGGMSSNPYIGKKHK